MAAGESYLAFDLGAESGRAILGTLTDDRLHLEEVHRFANTPVRVLNSLHWNVLQLWQEIKHSLCRLSANRGKHVAGIGVDSWAQDFALLDRHGALLGLPHHYRDSRTEGILEEVHRYISDEQLYHLTGLPGIPITTLAQLLAMRRLGSPALDIAHSLLLMSSLFTFWLSGQQVNEVTSAGMTQLYDLPHGDWARDWLQTLQLRPDLPAPVVPSATVLGHLLPDVAQEAGLAEVPIIATASHDTAAAVAALPDYPGDRTFISCGTWSVVGKEIERPLTSPDAMASGFLNEVGVCGTLMFAYNSSGLWPVQECRRYWQQSGHDWSYADLAEMAERAEGFVTILNPDASLFMRPGDIMAKVAEFCRRTHQRVPDTPGSLVRAFLEGLALRYRKVIDDLAVLTGRSTEVIHVIGGGSRNRLLCQLTADATGRPVLAGPDEATASGNLLLQALARGRLSSLSEVRQVVSRSFELVPYTPRPSPAWDERYATFLRLSA